MGATWSPALMTIFQRKSVKYSRKKSGRVVRCSVTAVSMRKPGKDQCRRDIQDAGPGHKGKGDITGNNRKDSADENTV